MLSFDKLKFLLASLMHNSWLRHCTGGREPEKMKARGGTWEVAREDLLSNVGQRQRGTRKFHRETKTNLITVR